MASRGTSSVGFALAKVPGDRIAGGWYAKNLAVRPDGGQSAVRREAQRTAGQSSGQVPINMKFAKALDVADPPSILVRPDEWSNKRSRVRFGHKGKHSAFACVVRLTLQRPDANLELARYCDMETDFHCLLCN
jgi:hypothetical protein